MLDDKDDFEPSFGLQVIGRMAVTNIARWAEAIARRQTTSPEQFFEDCHWLKEKILMWRSHIDSEFRSEGILPEGRQT